MERNKVHLTDGQIKNIVDAFENSRSEKEQRARDFISGKRPYMIFLTPKRLEGVRDARGPEESFHLNMKGIENDLQIQSDHMPFLWPYYGTGVFANMYGCEYYWRDGDDPCAHYRYTSMDEIRNLKRPSWEQGEVARLVVDTIKYFKKRTGDTIPIAWTDIQSASDTATLILSPTEVFAGCLLEPDLMRGFLQNVNDVTIEFIKVQQELIGDALAGPGSIVCSSTAFKNLAVSDDNIAVVSPDMAMNMFLPFDEEIGKVMDGIAIHSCGVWHTIMAQLKNIVPSCFMIECAVSLGADPNPNKPEDVRDALAGSGIAVQARMGGDADTVIEIVKKLLHKDLKLIINTNGLSIPDAEVLYNKLDTLLSDFYS